MQGEQKGWVDPPAVAGCAFEAVGHLGEGGAMKMEKRGYTEALRREIWLVFETQCRERK